ncbi:MAG TPA: hypothetical protein VNA57_01505 [Acidimicrobiales bacterium]|nr:hypothetical protein [Acidimicrobiales bacterium]
MTSSSEAEAAPDDAVAVAVAWVDAVMDRKDLRAAWPLMERDLRLVLAQHWVLSHAEIGSELIGPQPGWDMLAQGLAADPSSHPLWDRFAKERLLRWREYWGKFSTRTWKVRRTESPVPDVAIVTFAEPRLPALETKPGPPEVFRRLALRRSGGTWLVAGLDGRNIFRPGWPPFRA